jgi:plastocyanin
MDDNSSDRISRVRWRPFVIRLPPGDVDRVMRPTTTLPRLLALLAAGSLLLAACGDDDTDATASDTTAGEPSSDEASGAPAGAGELAISDFAYAPVELTAAPGAEIAISNDDTTAHTATAKDGAFDSGSIAAGEAGSVTAPEEPGEYPYICSFHPFMKGTLTVE